MPGGRNLRSTRKSTKDYLKLHEGPSLPGDDDDEKKNWFFSTTRTEKHRRHHHPWSRLPQENPTICQVATTTTFTLIIPMSQREI